MGKRTARTSCLRQTGRRPQLGPARIGHRTGGTIPRRYRGPEAQTVAGSGPRYGQVAPAARGDEYERQREAGHQDLSIGRP